MSEDAQKLNADYQSPSKLFTLAPFLIWLCSLHHINKFGRWTFACSCMENVWYFKSCVSLTTSPNFCSIWPNIWRATTKSTPNQLSMKLNHQIMEVKCEMKASKSNLFVSPIYELDPGECPMMSICNGQGQMNSFD